MDLWIEAKTQEDIAVLMNQFGGFHDSCLMKLQYRSGAEIQEGNFLCFGSQEDRELRMFFESQWGKKLELCFTGVRRFSIGGWQENFGCDILDCHFAIHKGLLRDPEQPLVVWADDELFDPVEWDCLGFLDEPMISVVIADSVKWRFC